LSTRRGKSNAVFYIGVGVLVVAILVGAAVATIGTRSSGGVVATPIPTGQSGPYPQLFADGLDRQVLVDLAPIRMISLSPSFTEIAFALGEGSHIIARDELSTYPVQAIEKPSLSKENRTVEKIKALNPDVVWLSPADKNLAADLDKAKITNLYFDEPTNLRAMISRIYLVSRLVNKRDFANEVVPPLEIRLSTVDNTLKGVLHGQGMKTYIELSSNLDTVSLDTLPGNFLYQLHTTNIFEKNAEKQFTAKSEDIIAANPDVIFLTEPADKENLETLKNRSGWSQIAAVKNGRVYNVDPMKVLYGTPRSVDELERLAKLVYPEKFK